MKFSTILTSTFFVLFIFTATLTVASSTDINTISNEKVQLVDKVDHIIHIVGRTAQVTGNGAARFPNGYMINVKVMRGMNIMAETSGNTDSVTMDLSNLDSGTYLFVIQTPLGITRKLVILE